MPACNEVGIFLRGVKMAFDGFCIGRIVKEYNDMLLDGKISKIIEPASHEIILVVKNNKDSFNVFMSANPAVPYTFITDEKPEAPQSAPNFCMVLRKHISNGKIVSVSQMGNERIIVFGIEHMNEMGDKSVKKLILELMGKYSNIILAQEDDTIIDSIKHVNGITSSLREVLPGKKYFVPDEITRISPYKDGEINVSYTEENIKTVMNKDSLKNSLVSNALAKEFEGVSKVAAKEILERAQIDSQKIVSAVNSDEIGMLARAFANLLEDMQKENGVYLYKDSDGEYAEYTTALYKSLSGYEAKKNDCLSTSLLKFYKSKQTKTANLQKSGDLVRFVKNILDKDNNKMTNWAKDLKDCENKEELKINGELLKAYAYSLKQGKSVKVLDYYTNEEREIELDERLSIIENSNRFYKAYNKAKRCETAVTELMEKTSAEIDYLNEILLFLSLSENASDIEEIKAELSERGFMRKKNIKILRKTKPKIKHYVYKDNYHIYVGKNNVQNEELTFKKAVGNDWWFHAKGIPGSHVIVKSDNDNPATEWDMPDDVFELCGALAAINCAHEGSSKVEIDYTRKKHIKKPAEGNRGMVIYHTYFSLVASPDISRFELTSIG